MAMMIVESCISCGACEPECPNEAIAQGDTIYTVAVEKCTECVGAFEKPKCVELCPVEDAIVKDPACPESQDELQAKYQRLH